MKVSLKTGLLAVGVLAASTMAYAAGYFPGFPIVGGASYCQGTSTYATGAQGCTVTVPAGPSVVTGNELIPADTTVGTTAAPATVYLPMASLNAMPVAYPTFASSTSVNAFTVSPLVSKVVIVSSNALSNTSVQMPASPIDGQELQVASSFTIATFNVSANTGQTVEANTKPTALTVATTGASLGYRWIWRAADSTWRRLQ